MGHGDEDTEACGAGCKDICDCDSEYEACFPRLGTTRNEEIVKQAEKNISEQKTLAHPHRYNQGRLTFWDIRTVALEALRLKDEEVKKVIRDWIREHHDMHMQKKSMGDITCVYGLEEHLSQLFLAGSDEEKELEKRE